MSYYGKGYGRAKTFDPNTIIQVNNEVTLTASSVNNLFILNAPANYTIGLPNLGTVFIGDFLTFQHGSDSGAVTLSAFSGDFVEVTGIGNSNLVLGPGDVITLQKTENISSWTIVAYSVGNKTLPQGTNDVKNASTAFVINEFGKHKNYLINPNFDFWQRGNSLAAGTGIRYLADRWVTESSSSTIAPSRQAFTIGQSDVPDSPRYFHRCVVTNVQSSGSMAIFSQRIEGVRTLSGKKATFSFYAKADAAKNIGIEFVQYFGGGGGGSQAVTGIGVTTRALSTSWAKYIVTVDLPSISGKTLGAYDNDYLVVSIWMNSGSLYNARSGSIGNQSGTFDFAQLQLEEGAVATQFEHRHPAIEQSLCERYYEKSYDNDVSPGTITSFGASVTICGSAANAVYWSYAFSIPKRTVPVITTYSSVTGASGMARNMSGTAFDIGATNMNSGKKVLILATTTTGTEGHQYAIHWTADAEL